MEFILSHTDEVLVSHSGLALTGALLQPTPLRKRLNDIGLGERKRPEVLHGDRSQKIPWKFMDSSS